MIVCFFPRALWCEWFINLQNHQPTSVAHVLVHFTIETNSTGCRGCGHLPPHDCITLNHVQFTLHHSNCSSVYVANSETISIFWSWLLTRRYCWPTRSMTEESCSRTQSDTDWYELWIPSINETKPLSCFTTVSLWNHVTFMVRFWSSWKSGRMKVWCTFTFTHTHTHTCRKTCDFMLEYWDGVDTARCCIVSETLLGNHIIDILILDKGLYW